MTDFDESSRPSKLHELTQAMTRALRSTRASLMPAAPPPSNAPPVNPMDDLKSRTWDPDEWAEDERYVQAMDLIVGGHKVDAMRKLALVYTDDPKHLFARQQLFALALELADHEKVREHIEWAFDYYSRRGENQRLCDSYRSTRMLIADFEWSERILVQALIAGDKAKDTRCVLDATKLLLQRFPKSAALPRAMVAGADCQLREGRADLAKTTLQSLIHRFPLDPLVAIAQRKLAEIA